MKKIILSNLPHPILIVPAKTGVIYWQQTGGCDCNYRELEGYLLPIMENLNNNNHFNPAVWYNKGRIDKYPYKKPDISSRLKRSFDKVKLTVEQAIKSYENYEENKRRLDNKVWWDDFIENLISLTGLRICRSKTSEEAWVWVRPPLKDDVKYHNGYYKFTSAVLTWQNCG